jgi:hypothetical protein
VQIRGWALVHDNDANTGEIRMDGHRPDHFQRMPSPGFPELFPWHDNTDVAAYHAVFENHGRALPDISRFSYCGRWTGNALNHWQDIYFPWEAWRNHLFVAPDGSRLIRAQGADSIFWYLLSGTTMAKILDNVTRMYFGRDLTQFRDICDWGCGCGRVIQALHGIAIEARISGLDIDRDNVEWCRTNLTYRKFFQVPLYPPTDIPGGPSI